jgi:glycosyltransferase involved in cell wall biosynthesis
MESSLISCIVPVFNGEKYLAEALDSIFAQTYPRLEVIVVDDGSTDRTATVIAAFGDRVRSLWQNNQGPAAARNRGLHAARGEFIAFLDADDLWHPEKLQRQMQRFQDRPELDYCVTYMQNFWIPELKDEAAKYRNHRITQRVPGYVTQTLMARLALFDVLGPFNPALGYGDGTEWFLRARERGAVVEVMPEVLVYRRLHPSNLSRLHAAESREEFLRILKCSLDSRRHLK